MRPNDYIGDPKLFMGCQRVAWKARAPVNAILFLLGGFISVGTVGRKQDVTLPSP